MSDPEPSPEPLASRPNTVALRTEALRYGSMMLRRFGWMHKLLGLGRALRHLELDEPSVDRVRTAAQRGPVVYVMLRTSNMDYLALNRVLTARRLPLSVWANGVRSVWWQPVWEAYRQGLRRLRSRWSLGAPPDPVQSGWLRRVVSAALPITVFLWPRQSWKVVGPRQDPLSEILAAQERTSEPIQLLPVIVVWNRAPESDGQPLRRFFLGNRETPGFFSRLRDLFLNRRNAFIQVGEPVDVVAFQSDIPQAEQLSALRDQLRKTLKRESQLIRGPTLLPAYTMRRLVLDNEQMRAVAEQEAQETGISLQRVQRRMEREYDAIAAHFRWWVIRLCNVILRPLWTQVFSGVDVPEADVERIRMAMRQGSVVLIPCHKSHFDYVLMAWVFHNNRLIVPHVVAGKNLAIPVVSYFLRSLGGFFIERKFDGKRLHPVIFARYLQELLRQEYPVEFFIEGGRTRSGKFLPPRVGVLSMVMDAAARRSPGREVSLLPISFAYEQVAEEAAYARELGGAAKTAESLGEFAKATRVLRRRFGRVYFRVGEPIPCSSYVDASEETLGWEDRAPEERKAVLNHMGEHVLHRIGRVTVLLPTSLVALALLAHHRRGILHEELKARIHRFHAFLVERGAEQAASLDQFDLAVRMALIRFTRHGLIQPLEDPEHRVWAIDVDGRITLEFYKNQVLHFFVLAGYVAVSIRVLPPGPFSSDDITENVDWLGYLLRREFILDPYPSAEERRLAGLDALVSYGALSRDADGLYRVADEMRIGEIFGLFRSVLESYHLLLHLAPEQLRRPKSSRDLAKAIQGQRTTLTADGLLTRPESLSLVNLQNAIRVYVEEGVLQRADSGMLSVDDDALEAELSRLTPLVS